MSGEPGTDLSSFERKIEQVLALCQNLRSENQDLRGRVVGLESERQRLVEKIDTACARLEVLMTKLPAE